MGPVNRAGTVIQPGGEGVIAQAAAAITKLDTDHAHAGCGETVAPTHKARVSGCHQHHTAAMHMHDARTRLGLILGHMQIQRNVMAVDTLDGLGGRHHRVKRRHHLPLHGMARCGGILESLAIGDAFFVTSVGGGWCNAATEDCHGLHDGLNARISPWVGDKRRVRVAQLSRFLGISHRESRV